MKREKGILKIVNCLIKKIFFKSKKTDFYQECKEGINIVGENDNEVEEYVKNYQSTTRWQTV